MTTPKWRNRRGVLVVAAVTAVAAAAGTGLAAPALARSSAPASTTVRGPGYPPPKGIYAPFTNCPLKNPVMHEAMDTNGGGFAACVGGLATGGSIQIGNIVTPVVENVDVQFGFFIPPADANFYPAPAVPPLAGTSAILSTKPDPLPETLTQALSCPSSNATVETLCREAQANGGQYNKVYALAQEAGNISNFALLSWTQPLKFKLINPLLGGNCYIGSDETPVMVNPSLSLGPGGSLNVENDPVPTVHPDTFVFALTGAVASDNTFSAPGVTGCGPGGVANVAVDDALDASSGVPSPPGTNNLTLTGNFYVGATTTSEDPSLTQPQDDASGLLAAFKASTNGEHSVKHKITMKQMRALLGPHS